MYFLITLVSRNISIIINIIFNIIFNIILNIILNIKIIYYFNNIIYLYNIINTRNSSTRHWNFFILFFDFKY